MIEEKLLNTWQELQDELDNLANSLGEKSEDLMYRGQPDSSWKLRTTMERKLVGQILVSDYYRYAHSAKTRVETFVNTNWNIPTPPDYDKWLKEKDTLTFYDMPAYDYLAYLRHHGFPSPFLDWTASPYIAAFFAYRDCDESDGFVSIYCYLEHADVGKIRSSDKPAIYVFGPYVKVHKRHVLQQSQYSICVELDDSYKPVYANHEIVFEESDERQDKLWKFNLPKKESRNVIKSLNQMNINAFSLFGTEDSLIESIAINEIINRGL